MITLNKNEHAEHRNVLSATLGNQISDSIQDTKPKNTEQSAENNLSVQS